MTDKLRFTTFYFYFGLVVCELILCCFNEKPPLFSDVVTDPVSYASRCGLRSASMRHKCLCLYVVRENISSSQRHCVFSVLSGRNSSVGALRAASSSRSHLPFKPTEKPLVSACSQSHLYPCLTSLASICPDIVPFSLESLP